MTLIIGWVIVIVSAIGGFMISGGNPFMLFRGWGECIIVAGSALGFLVGASPPETIKFTTRLIVRSCRGSVYSQKVYIDLVQMMYEIFIVGRQQGLVGLENHVLEPRQSSIVTRYPSFLKNYHALEFFVDAMKPVIDGKLKADQLKSYLDTQLTQKDFHDYQPVSLLSKVADALPGLGIVAAVLGIILTMGSIDQAVGEVGMHVASALVGTFIGVFLSYGIVQPLATNIDFLNHDEFAYYSIMRNGIVTFASGSSPLAAAENMRTAIPEDRRIDADSLENMLKKSQR
ncbi:MAG: flagellar motor stator protein MotA [Verrucomicrobia bacterium]|nr:flagellar motor stator protein MotA [Verrucomicrobiota bacterium]